MISVAFQSMTLLAVKISNAFRLNVFENITAYFLADFKSSVNEFKYILDFIRNEYFDYYSTLVV